MERRLYSSITNFAETTLKDKDIRVGFILKAEYEVEIISNRETIDLKQMQKYVGGYIEYVSYIQDENFDVLVDEEGVLKEKKFNMLAYLITGYELYGDVLVLRKGILR